MSPERFRHIEIPETESKKESLIDLKALSFNFCSEDFLHSFYNRKLQQLENKEKWLAEYGKQIEENKKALNEAVQKGLIRDSEPETIRNFQIDREKEKQKRVMEIISTIQNHADEIKDDVAQSLSKFLPDWSPAMEIMFTINKKADFCINDEGIIVDLERLVREDNPLETIKKGIIHELFHFWMSQEDKDLGPQAKEKSTQALREKIIFKTIDEGLAVLISCQRLEEHHKEESRSYDEYIKESFKIFNRFLGKHNQENLKKIQDKEFQNMGHFYVVGYEIARAILEAKGIEQFKTLILRARHNPAIFLQEYKELCSQNPKLPRINF